MQSNEQTTANNKYLKLTDNVITSKKTYSQQITTCMYTLCKHRIYKKISWLGPITTVWSTVNCIRCHLIPGTSNTST